MTEPRHALKRHEGKPITVSCYSFAMDIDLQAIVRMVAAVLAGAAIGAKRLKDQKRKKVN